MKKITERNFVRTDFLILFIILIIAFVFRLYKINTPLADLHSWRQTDTAAVGRNFVKMGFDLMHPRFDDLSVSSTGKENPQGYRMVEFPIYNAIFAILYKILPLLSLEVYARLTSVFFTLIITAIIYYFSLKEHSRLAAIASSMIYAIFPFFVFFSRVVLPEPTALGFTFLSLFFLYLFTNKKNSPTLESIYVILSLICFSTGLLIKPTVLFFGLALIYLFFRKYQMSTFKNPLFYAYFIFSVIPLLGWREYIKNFPEGIPPSDWLISMVNTSAGQVNIFFRPAFFRWIFYERINQFISGGYMVIFLVIGIIAKQKKYFVHSLIASAFLYLFVFQGGNVQHEYYQTLILPPLAMAMGLGIAFLMEHASVFIHPVCNALIILAVCALSFFFSYYRVRDYYTYPVELPQIAKIVATLTNPEDKIITERNGDSTLLYLTGRRGSPSLARSLEIYKNEGYAYFVTLTKDVIENIRKEGIYPIIFENNQFALIKL